MVDLDTLVVVLISDGPGTGDVMMVGALQGQLGWATGEVVSCTSTHKGPGKRSSLKCLGMSRRNRQDSVERALAPCSDS